MQSQVEASTPPSSDFGEAREVLGGLRAGLAGIAREHRLLVFAAGTHPIARWSRQSHTAKDRYETLTRELRLVGRRSVVCGMHVHVEVPRPETRVDLMNRLMPFTPLLLALSAASPFWQGRATGLAGYRLCVFGEMPRSGLPDLFGGAEDYDRFVRTMTQRRRDPGCELPVVGRAALPQIPDFGAARRRQLHRSRPHARRGGAVAASCASWPADRTCTGTSPAARGPWPPRTSGARSATARAPP